jgi:hypothetical protein
MKVSPVGEACFARPGQAVTIMNNVDNKHEAGEPRGQADAASPSAIPTIKRDGYFYAGLAALGLAGTVMPISVCTVPLLGLSSTQTAMLLGVLATLPDTLCFIAIALLGTEIFQFMIQRTKNALRSFAEGRFRAGGHCFLILSVVERLLDRLLKLVELYARPLQICRNAATFLVCGGASMRPAHD